MARVTTNWNDSSDGGLGAARGFPHARFFQGVALDSASRHLMPHPCCDCRHGLRSRDRCNDTLASSIGDDELLIALSSKPFMANQWCKFSQRFAGDAAAISSFSCRAWVLVFFFSSSLSGKSRAIAWRLGRLDSVRIRDPTLTHFDQLANLMLCLPVSPLASCSICWRSYGHLFYYLLVIGPGSAF